ncbi:MAG TPA: C4-type zinc ribbon domain-containing protein [Pyrinomonadaceae bacterium]|nr:C4-type zinc ribbon domain-containing protein [Pyrinomonadaceae bacterium]
MIALQNADTSIRRLQAEIEAIPRRRAEIEKEFDQRAFEIRELERQRDDSRQERVRLETEIQEQRERAERAERNLMSSKKQDEYTAAIREADAARKHISQLETQILEKMESFEQAESKLKEREPEMARLSTEMEARIKEFEELTLTQQEQLEANRKERERLAAMLPKNMSSLYNRISARIRDGIAVAEARNGSCTACFMSLRPQVMAEVRRGDDVITCDNCNRILYYVPAEKARKEVPATV